MKAVLCDICGKPVEWHNLMERYCFWVIDPLYVNKKFDRLDICYDCKEKMVEIINAKKLRKGEQNGTDRSE